MNDLKNKRVLLVHPEIARTKYNFRGVIDNEPLELEMLWTLLKAEGAVVDIWDGQVEEKPFRARMRSFRPDAVYICGRTRQEPFMKEYCTEVKAYNKDAYTVIGGLHAQINPNRFFDPATDAVITSCDPYVTVALLKGEKPRNLDGVCFRDAGGRFRRTKALPFDADKLPRPDRTQFLRYRHRYRYLDLAPCAHVRTALSCPYHCDFCYRNHINCGTYTVRDIEDVVEEIASVDCDNIYIFDDDFLLNEQRLERFITLLKERGIRKQFVCYGRADFIASHPSLMEELAKAGMTYVLVGLEFVEERRLNRFRKGTSEQENISAIKICKKAGIRVMGLFIAEPDFRAKDFRNMYRFIKRHDLRHVGISLFVPEMGLPIFSQYRDRLVTTKPEHWDYLHVVVRPTHMGVRRYYFYYHVLLLKLFIRGYRQGIYSFLDYKGFIRSIAQNMFRFGGNRSASQEAQDG